MSDYSTWGQVLAGTQEQAWFISHPGPTWNLVRAHQASAAPDTAPLHDQAVPKINPAPLEITTCAQQNEANLLLSPAAPFRVPGKNLVKSGINLNYLILDAGEPS